MEMMVMMIMMMTAEATAAKMVPIAAVVPIAAPGTPYTAREVACPQ